jgi:hypothetical protein
LRGQGQLEGSASPAPENQDQDLSF